MALTHVVGVRNKVADVVVDEIDLGTTDANGDLVFQTSGDVEVATLGMTNPAFGAAAAGIATASAISDDTSPTGGTVAKFKLQTRDNNEVLQGSVTAPAGGGDIELSSLVIAVTDTVSMTSLTYTAPV